MRILSVKQMKQLVEDTYRNSENTINENTPEGGIVFYEIEYEAIKDSYGKIQWQLIPDCSDNPSLMVTDGKFGATELIPCQFSYLPLNNSYWVENNLIDGLNPIENKDWDLYKTSNYFSFDWNIYEFVDYEDEKYTQGVTNIMPGMKMTNFVVFNKNEIQMMIDLLSKGLNIKGCDLDD